MAAALCYGVRGGGAQLAFHVQAGNYDTDSLIWVLGQLRKFLVGEKATLLWDGTACPPTAAARCWPGCAPSGPGWWSSGCRRTRPTSTGRGAVVQPQGRRARQPQRPDPW
jgi:hypothetical protein